MYAAKVVRNRKLAATEPLYVICRNRVLASLAAGMLQASGCIHPVVVEGGMDTWATQGLPVMHKRLLPKFAVNVPTAAALAGFAAGLAFAAYGLFFVVALIAIIAVAGQNFLLLRRKQIARYSMVDLGDFAPVFSH